MRSKCLTAIWGISAAAMINGCATSNKDGLSGPYVNMEEPHYDSSIERSKDRPAIEREARVDFFKYKQGF